MPEPFTVKAADGHTDLYGFMWKPFDFDSTRRYPIISYVYPGPQTEAIQMCIRDRPLSYAGVNSIGLRRRGFVNEKINEIQDIYRILFQSGLNNSDAVERIAAEMPASKERDEIIMFVRNSKRGVMKGYMG